VELHRVYYEPRSPIGWHKKVSCYQIVKKIVLDRIKVCQWN